MGSMPGRVAPRELLVDDRDNGSARTVRRLELASLLDRHAHRGEVLRTDAIDFVPCRKGGRRSRHGEARRRSSSRCAASTARPACTPRARHRPRRAERQPRPCREMRRGSRVSSRPSTRLDLRDDRVVDVEAGVDLRGATKIAQEQQRGQQQHERHGDLPGDEQTAECPPTVHVSRLVLLQGGHQRRPRRLNRGSKPAADRRGADHHG